MKSYVYAVTDSGMSSGMMLRRAYIVYIISIKCYVYECTDSGMSSGMMRAVAANATRPEPAGPEAQRFYDIHTIVIKYYVYAVTDSGMSSGMMPAAAANATRPEPAGKEMPIGKRVCESPPVPTVSGSSMRLSQEWMMPSPGRMRRRG